MFMSIILIMDKKLGVCFYSNIFEKSVGGNLLLDFPSIGFDFHRKFLVSSFCFCHIFLLLLSFLIGVNWPYAFNA